MWHLRVSTGMCTGFWWRNRPFGRPRQKWEDSMVHKIVTFTIKDCKDQTRSAVYGAHSPHLQLCSIVWKLLPPSHLTTRHVTKEPCKIRLFKSFHLTHKWKSEHNPTVQTFFITFTLLTDDIRTRRQPFWYKCEHLKPGFILQNPFLQGI